MHGHARKKFHHAYAYAPNGNLTRKDIYDPTTDTVDDRWTYTYNNHAVQSINTTKGGNRFAMGYDDSGNMIHQRDATKNISKDIEFDSNNRITNVTNPDTGKKIGEYWYDDQGFRVRKIAAEIDNGVEKQVELLYPSMYFAIEKQRTSTGEVIAGTAYAVNNIYFNGIRIAASLPNGSCQYYLTDQVDSVSIVMDDAASIVTRTEYLPYGETWFQEGNTNNRPKYNSQELDAETNFYFYNARYQDPEICRFVTADNVIDGEYDTQGWNRYSYCKGNPILYKDPTGHNAFTEWLSSMIKSDDDAQGRATHTGVSGDYAEDSAKKAGTNNTTQAKNLEKGKGKIDNKVPGWVTGKDSAQLFQYLSAKTGDKEIDAQKAAVMKAIDAAYDDSTANIRKYGKNARFGASDIPAKLNGEIIDPLKIKEKDGSLGFIGDEKQRLDNAWKNDPRYSTKISAQSMMTLFDSLYSKDRARVYKHGENAGIRFDSIHFDEQDLGRENDKVIMVHFDRFDSNTAENFKKHCRFETSSFPYGSMDIKVPKQIRN